MQGQQITVKRIAQLFFTNNIAKRARRDELSQGVAWVVSFRTTEEANVPVLKIKKNKAGCDRKTAEKLVRRFVTKTTTRERTIAQDHKSTKL